MTLEHDQLEEIIRLNDEVDGLQKDIREHVSVFLITVIISVLFFSSLPYLQYRAFIADCSERWTVIECKAMWSGE